VQYDLYPQKHDLPPCPGDPAVEEEAIARPPQRHSGLLQACLSPTLTVDPPVCPARRWISGILNRHDAHARNILWTSSILPLLAETAPNTFEASTPPDMRWHRSISGISCPAAPSCIPRRKLQRVRFHSLNESPRGRLFRPCQRRLEQRLAHVVPQKCTPAIWPLAQPKRWRIYRPLQSAILRVVVELVRGHSSTVPSLAGGILRNEQFSNFCLCPCLPSDTFLVVTKTRSLLRLPSGPRQRAGARRHVFCFLAQTRNGQSAEFQYRPAPRE